MVCCLHRPPSQPDWRQRDHNPDHRDDGVGNAQAQVVVGMDTRLRMEGENIFQRPESVAHVAHIQPPGVDHIDAVSTVAFHQLALLPHPLGGLHMAHHQEANHIHVQLSCVSVGPTPTSIENRGGL